MEQPILSGTHKTDGSHLRLHVRLWVIAGIGLLVAGIIGGSQLGWFEIFVDLERMRERILSYGVWAPAAVIALNAIQVVLSPIPGHALNMASGYIFGPWIGTLLTLIGMVIGSSITLLLIRWLGRPFVEQIVGRKHLSRFDEIIHKRGRLLLFFLFLLPFLPDDAICMIAGLTPLPIHQILLLAVFGRAPGLFVANWIGHSATALPLWGWGIIGAVLVLFASFLWRYQSHLETLSLRLAQLLSTLRPGDKVASNFASFEKDLEITSRHADQRGVDCFDEGA